MEYYYMFTNSEREIFTSAEKLQLEHDILNSSDSIQIYGIPHKAKTDRSKLFRIPYNGMIHSIDYYSNLYDSISQENYDVIYDTNEVILDREILKNYKEFVVDYAKKNSYAINFSDDVKQYEIEVSSTEKGLNILYDMQDDGSINNTILTKIVPDKNKYIVLRRQG